MSFDSKFFDGNRKRLMLSLPNHFIVLAAHNLLQMSGDQTFPFRQDSNFWYLTGLQESDLVICIDTTSSKTILFLPERSEFHTDWDGAYDISEFRVTSGIDTIEPITKLNDYILNAHKKNQKIGYLEPLEARVEPYGFYSNPARANLASIIKKIDPYPQDIRMDLARLRQVKQPEELAAIQSAIDITGSAMLEVQDYIKSQNNLGLSEQEIENIFSKNFVKSGGHAYEPIIASGKNAATIHYMKNSQKLMQDAFLLMDVGAKVNGYSADISRTWFIGIKPTDRHKQLYGAVLDIQNYAFELLKPGVILKEYQDLVEVFAFKQFKKLNVNIEKYPHGFSHFLGLDTHDAGDYLSPLLENSVITVEPGIYLPDEGIGIRIEDNVRITGDGIDVMSKQIPSNLLYL